MMKEGKKYPCEQCVDGIYMNVEEMWWCDKHLKYACQMEKNHLCEKFERDDAVSRTPTRPAQEALAIERYQDLVDYFDDEDVAKTILGSREGFKQWLARMKWHVEKTDELARKLDQKPCEDCVSRQDVLDMATIIETDDYSGNEIMEVVDVDDIKALPSVTPAPKKGKWIDTDVTLLNRQGCLVYEVICSECNGISYFRKMGNKYIGANLCPNCGAKMEAEKNE